MLTNENGVTYVGLNELVTWMDGISTRRILQLVDEGAMPREGRGKYPLKACLLAYIRHLKSLAEGVGRTSELSHEKLLTARIERKRRELEYAEQEGTLITVESHKAAMAEALDLVRSNIRNLPGAIAPRLVGIDDAREVQAILSPAVDDTLRSIVTKAERRISADGSLPDDMPGRARLMKAGITTLVDLLETSSLTALPGVGPATAKKVRAWLEDARMAE